MKLNWFSPLPPARTDIGHYTARIVPALAQGAEVTLWTDQEQWDRDLERHARVVHFDPDDMPLRELNRGDMTFYNIGNNADFHLKIWQVSQKYPGVVVLHDARVQEFFSFVHRWLLGDKELYLDQLERHCGPTARRDGVGWWNNQRTMEYMVERYSMTRWALQGALGAFVHTQQAFDEARRARCLPVGCSPLPYPCTQGTKWPAHRAALYRQPPYRLIFFGYIHQNRRLEPFLEALAAMPNRASFRLAIYGELWDRKHIEGRIHCLGLKDFVSIHGFVPEPELDAALSQAHLAINLRYPTMGEASGSQLRIWSHALSSLVTQIGMYATLPDDAVVFVRPDHEQADIQRHLRALVSDPLRFAEMGRVGLQVLAEKHSPESYARAIITFAREAARTRRYKAACELADLTAQAMRPWRPEAMEDMGLRAIAERIHGLLC